MIRNEGDKNRLKPMATVSRSEIEAMMIADERYWLNGMRSNRGTDVGISPPGMGPVRVREHSLTVSDDAQLGSELMLMP